MIEDTKYPKFSWPFLIALIIVMLVLLVYFDKAIAEEVSPRDVAMKSIDKMGGLESWKKVGAIRFDFRVEVEGKPPRAVKHLWDRKNSRDHIEGNYDGKPTVAWVDLHRKQGKAWVEGKELQGEELTKAMEWAYGRWVNDSYWLIMPFKWLDPGVNLKYEGEKNGKDVLHLSFQKVGITPGDQYWVYIDKKTGLMDRWEFLLQDKDKGDFSFTDYKEVGGVKLSSLKTSADGQFRIRFEPLKAMDSADQKYFGAERTELPD